MMIKQTIFITLFLIYNSWTAFIKDKYNIEIDNVDVCQNNDQLKNPLRHLRYSRINRTHKALNFDFVYDRPIDENVGGNMLIDRWGDGGWKPVPFFGFQSNICKTMLTYSKVNWVSFHKSAGVQDPDHCPVPAGNYSLKNYVVDTSGISIPFWSGRYRLTLKFEDATTKDVVLCYIYYVKIAEIL